MRKTFYLSFLFTTLNISNLSGSYNWGLANHQDNESLEYIELSNDQLEYQIDTSYKKVEQSLKTTIKDYSIENQLNTISEIENFIHETFEIIREVFIFNPRSDTQIEDSINIEKYLQLIHEKIISIINNFPKINSNKILQIKESIYHEKTTIHFKEDYYFFKNGLTIDPSECLNIFNSLRKILLSYANMVEDARNRNLIFYNNYLDRDILTLYQNRGPLLFFDFLEIKCIFLCRILKEYISSPKIHNKKKQLEKFCYFCANEINKSINLIYNEYSNQIIKIEEKDEYSDYDFYYLF